MKPRRGRSIVTRRARIALSVLALYLSASGLVTFSLFIIEESIQSAMFGTWQASDAGDWWTVKFAADRISDANRLLRMINIAGGWIQPLSFLAYRSYGRATEAYLAALEAKLLAKAPELFVGRIVTVSFTALEARPVPSGYAHTNHRLTVLSPVRHPTGVPRRLTGLVSVQGSQVVITETDSDRSVAADPLDLDPATRSPSLPPETLSPMPDTSPSRLDFSLP